MALLLCCLLTLSTWAQGEATLIVNVRPTQDVLPPQVGDYKANPQKYFDLSLINTTGEEVSTYLAVQIIQTFMADGTTPSNLSISSPPTRMPMSPIVVPAGGTVDLSAEQMRRIFDHIPLSEMQFSSDLFSTFGAADYGLLPEGQYKIVIAAYKWDPTLLDETQLVVNPVPLSNPSVSGYDFFRVCYRAQAPQFTSPVAVMGTTEVCGLEAIQLPLMDPTFEWSEPVVNCHRDQTPMYQYTLTIREVLRTGQIQQSVDDVLSDPGYVLRISNVSTSPYTLNYSHIKKLLDGHVYVAQVEAKPIGINEMNFLMVENQGKSQPLVFTPLMSGGTGEDIAENTDESAQNEEEGEEDDEEEEDVDISMLGITTEFGDETLYVFRNPELVKPDFNGNTNNTLFAGNTLNAEWKRPMHAGGEGLQQDTLKFRYKVQVFNLSGYATKEIALEQEPVYEGWAKGESGVDLIVDLTGKTPEQQIKALKTFAKELGWLVEIWTTHKEPHEVIPIGGETRAQMYYRQLTEKYNDVTTEKAKEQIEAANKLITQLEGGEDVEISSMLDVLKDNVRWELLSQKISVGQALLLRVVPECYNQESVRFYGDVNELPFMYSDKLSEAFGDACAGGVIEENRVPGTFTKEEMSGQEIFVGEYIMTTNDDVKQDPKTQGWSGTGFILWEPFGQKVKVGVKFENIFINADRIMYDGIVKTETKSNWQHIKDRAKQYAKDYSDTSELGDWIPDDIFTEWGLDNLVGYATPEELKNTLAAGVGNYMAQQEANTLAAKVKASKYYDYVRKGYAVYDNFQKKGIGGFPDIEVFMPLQISDVHSTPVDVQIMSMEFHPTFAWMNLLGMFSLPDNDITEDNILMFGAPRLCMDPDRVLPGSGYLTLLSDVTLNDPNSSFKFTFKAPKDFQEPKDGCYMHWEADTLSGLSIDANMQVPGLIGCVNQGGKYVSQTGSKPRIMLQAFIRDWDDWKAAVSVDPFMHEDAKGWVFWAENVTYDHSATSNPASLKFPTDKGFDKDEAGIIDGNDLTWQGFFLQSLHIQLPSNFIGGSNSNISADNMIIDASGVSSQINYNNAIDGEWGGWKMHLKHIFLNIVQNNFKDCGFDGTMHVPLMKEDMAFTCNMYPIEREDGTSDFDFVLKCVDDSKLNDIKFDFFLAELNLDREQTYFLLESRVDPVSADGDRETRVELCLGGDITIGGAETANQYLDALTADLPIRLQIPGVHFTQMRIANCERWIADDDREGGKEIAALQNKASDRSREKKNNFALYEICKQNTYKFGENFYFERGWWSVSSVEKKIGPFQFGITGYDVVADISKKTAGLSITGRIALMDKGGKYDNDVEKNALVSVAVTVEIDCTVDVAKKEFKYKETNLNEIELNLNADFACVKLQGKLKIGDGNSTTGISRGFAGNISVTLPGDLLHFTANGGFFEHTEGYKWGYVYLAVGGTMGVQITPLQITNIGAGIYFNCHADTKDKTKVTPKKGLIGVMADLGLASSDGTLISGDFHMSVVYDKNRNGLTTFLFTGDCKAVAGIIDSKVTIHWQNDDKDKFFQLTATVDVTADGSTVVNALGKAVGANELVQQMKLLNDKWESAKGAVTGTLEHAMQDDSEEKAKPTNANMKDVDAEQKGKPMMGAHASLDLKLTFRENGQNLSKCKWHIYLGEPEESKRCAFTLIDLHTHIVDVKIGANFYFCVGNELPNNGQLPEIPKKIRDFLNGGNVGGMQSADMGKANNARNKALKMFSNDAAITGGVMVGAAWYGSVDVDLGIFYGDMGAIAGFDATIAHLKNNDCPGYGTMGYKGWYGEGQIYAYLWAKFGIHVDLGFWDKPFDIINAGIGGVLKAGLPHPNYFVGDARIKLKLLGGLVNINRRFQFECGHVCNIFYGNPLDNFELFGDCTIGSANVKEGWAKDAELVSPAMIVKPVYNTQAPMNENFRVLDENTLHQLAENYKGDIEELEMQSKRTFVFHHKSLVHVNNQPVLMEFYNLPDTTGLTSDDSATKTANFIRLYNTKGSYKYYITQKTIGQTVFQLSDLTSKLKPNRYYCLAVMGNAMEIIKGEEQNPQEYHQDTHKWEQRPWNQVQMYFFRTGSEAPEVEDAADLEPYVALAYPSDKGVIRNLSGTDTFESENTRAGTAAPLKKIADSTNSTVYVYQEDANNPNIALTQQLFFTDAWGNNRTAKQGYPYSQVHKDNIFWVAQGTHKNGNTFSHTSAAKFVTTDNSQNIVGHDLGWQEGDIGTLSLVYKYYEYSTHVENEITGYETRGDITTRPSGSSSSTTRPSNSSSVTRPSASSSTNKSRGSSSSSSSTSRAKTSTATESYVVGTFTTATKQERNSVLAAVSAIKQTKSSNTAVQGIKLAETSTKKTGIKMADSSTDNKIVITGISNVNLDYDPDPTHRNKHNTAETVAMYQGKVVKDSTAHFKVLYSLKIRVENGNWREGYTNSTGTYQFNYCEPYIGMIMTNLEKDNSLNQSMTDDKLVDDTEYRLENPDVYLSYLANFFYIGGHGIENYSFTDNEDDNGFYVPTAESLTYYTKGGQTSGNYRPTSSTNIYDGISKIKKLSVYNHDSRTFNGYPLPIYPDIHWAPLVTGFRQTPLYVPSKDQATRVKNLLGDIAGPYYLAEAASKMLRGNMLYVNSSREITDFRDCQPAWIKVWDEMSTNNFKKQMQAYNNYYTGLYKEVFYSRPNGQRTYENGKSTGRSNRDTVSIEIPYYQLPLVFGGTFNHGGNTKNFTLHESMPNINKGTKSRVGQTISSKLFFKAAGGVNNWQSYKQKYKEYYGTKTYQYSWKERTYYNFKSYSNTGTGSNGMSYQVESFDAAKALKHIKKIDINVYRVNTYNYNEGLFEVSNLYNTHMTNKFTVSLEDPFSSSKTWKNDGKTNSY